MDLGYSIREWKDAYEQAEIDKFKGTSALDDWPLAQFMCGTVDTNEMVGKDPLIMQGAINMLESEGVEDFSPEFFVTVLGTANGQTVDDFQELVDEHVKENYGGQEPELAGMDEFARPVDWEFWYREHVLESGEAYGEIDAGGTLYWFNRGTAW